MDISVKLKKLIAKLRVPCYAFGLEFMDLDYKFSLRTLNSAIVVIVYLTCSAYTICTAESLLVWQCLAALGMGVQGCVKFQIPVRFYRQGRAEIDKMETTYINIQRQGQSSLEYKLLATCVHVCDKVFNLYMLVFACGFVMAVSYSLIMYYCFDEKVLLITMLIPGIDPFGQYGFIIHGVCHVIMAFINCVGSPAGDFFFILCIAHICVYAEFLRFRIERFNDWLMATQNEVHDRDWCKLSTKLWWNIKICWILWNNWTRCFFRGSPYTLGQQAFH
jgi:hypothetical protein